MDVYGAPPGGLSGDFYGGHPFGVLAEDLPDEGLNGGSYLRECVTLPADVGKRVRGPITRQPTGTLVVFPDGTFDYVGPTDYALFRLYVLGTPDTTDIGYGPGIGRIDLGMEAGGTFSGAVQLDDVVAGGSFNGGNASTFSGNVQLDNVVAGGSASGGSPSDLSGNVQLGDVVAAGQFQGATVSEFGGNVTLDDVAASGTFVGDLSNEPLPQGQRLVHADRQTPLKFRKGLDITEQDVLTFEFWRVLDGETVVTAAPTSEARVGTDVDAASLLLGQHQVHGTQVRMRINGVGRVPGVIYLVRCPTTLSSGRVVTPAAFIRVVRRA